MRVLSISLVCLVAVAALPACRTIPRQPEVLRAEIVPNVLKPGDSAVVRASFQDKFGVIDRVEGIIPDDPSIVFKLRDNGVAPDDQAGDGVWSLIVDVPFNAPPGEFVMELTAYNSLDEPVLVHNDLKEVAPLSATCTLTIQYDE